MVKRNIKKQITMLGEQIVSLSSLECSLQELKKQMMPLPLELLNKNTKETVMSVNIVKERKFQIVSYHLFSVKVKKSILKINE